MPIFFLQILTSLKSSLIYICFLVAFMEFLIAFMQPFKSSFVYFPFEGLKQMKIAAFLSVL